MRNLTPQRTVNRVFDRILDSLSEDHLRQRIDAPFDAAVAAFVPPADAIASQVEFLDVVGAFIKHVYARGILFPQKLSGPQARAEALHLLDQGYKNAFAAGYHAALVDAMDTMQDGLRVVLAALAEIIRSTERWKYASCMLRSAVDPLDWNAQLQITETVLETCREWLPETVLRCPTAQLTGEWVSILLLHLDTDRVLLGALRGSLAFTSR